ncbi:aminoacyl-tRNA hydrolase [Pararhizobium haloflavum]|uniref:aminoacyl-tRNA hydrolase n=1 Tax=Pararhizobium haloflavum TaxID=2037914 RepID=UPI000C181959|nr:aminoacyl-tRNA hydrolase [Pararhizobium haloflavum]
MQIIAGLGNPGARYAGNRHNIGFMAVDEIARANGFSPWSKKFKAEIAEGELGGEKVLLLKPQTFMNVSGEAVGEAIRFYKLGPDALTVIYDELDLQAGKARIKTAGGHGGHNGIKSIDAHVGKDYRRVRLGIGHPGAKELVHNHVLGDFSKADRAWLEPFLAAIGENAAMLVQRDDSGFMNKLALSLTGAAQAPAPTAPVGKPAKGRSHIRQANRPQSQGPAPTGPMADMLKRLFGGKSGD